MGVDLHADETGRARALLYAPRAVEQTLGTIAVDSLGGAGRRAGAEVPSTMPMVFRARSVDDPLRHVRAPADLHVQRAGPGRLRGRVRPPGRLLPQDGLILDVRGNGGGHIFASEFTLQTLTPAADHPGAGAVQLHRR